MIHGYIQARFPFQARGGVVSLRSEYDTGTTPRAAMERSFQEDTVSVTGPTMFPSRMYPFAVFRLNHRDSNEDVLARDLTDREDF
jgi:hypothetical protein